MKFGSARSGSSSRDQINKAGDFYGELRKSGTEVVFLTECTKWKEWFQKLGVPILQLILFILSRSVGSVPVFLSSPLIGRDCAQAAGGFQAGAAVVVGAFPETDFKVARQDISGAVDAAKPLAVGAINEARFNEVPAM